MIYKNCLLYLITVTSCDGKKYFVSNTKKREETIFLFFFIDKNNFIYKT